MFMDLTHTIESAENIFKQILEDFFVSVYKEQSLSSHGIDHHRRVWNYSKELLELVPLKDSVQIYRLATELIIACFLHDIGMSVDTGIRHGKHSRNLCIQFLNRNNLPQNDFHDVLEAIEYHDNKDYAGNSSRNELLTVLSVSDDLDAFGFIGIFRYSEIYLTRGLDPDKIGYLIRENAEKRFDNFVKTFGSESEIVQKHRNRYIILDNFFFKYNEQVPSYHFGTKNPSGFCGVLETFVFMINNKIGLEEIYLNSKKYMVDPVIRWYFSELEKELSFFGDPLTAHK
jgi:HD superfamily phosphodiesterase